MAYQSEIELRVRVLDKELREAEKRIENITNPFGASGARRRGPAQVASLRAQKAEAQLIKRSIDDLDRLRNTKAEKTLQTNLKRVRFLRDQRIKAARDVAQAEKKFAAEQQRLQAAAVKRRNRRRTDIATGAGFPLLFGGGPLQALAGGIGGAAGGLGGAIAASAIVSQVEAFATAAAQAGQALNSTGGALDFMREKSLFSTSAVEERAAVLEEQGRVEELAALLTQELTEKIGNEGVRSLQELGKTTDETTRLWSELTTQLFALISGPLNDFLKIVNQVLGSITGRGRFEGVQRDFAGNEAFEAAVLEKRKARGKGARLGALQTADQQDLIARAQAGEFGQVARPVSIPVTAADQRRFAVRGRAGGADKAAREEARIKQRLAALEVERQKILEISGFKDKIAAAEALNDTQTVIRLQGQQKLGEIEAKRLSDLTKVTDQRLKDKINIVAATEKLAAHREMERQLGEDQRQRQELFETTLEGLQHQLDMTEATSQAERDRLKIAKDLKKLEKQGFTGDQLAQAESIMEQLAVAQQPLNAFIRKTTEDLNNLQQVAVDVSQGIGNAIGSSLVNGLQGLVTGAASIKQVFANLLKSVADVLANTAAKMIAQYIAIGIARTFAGIGGGFGSGASAPKIGTDTNYFGGGFSPASFFAEGGYVSGPTNAVVGEGGESEYIIPESKMRESMARYSRGARGSAVVPEAGGSGTSGEGGGTAVAAPIDVRYTVERINSVDYVTADQFQAGMQRAADQGAKQGEQKTLKRLQMSSGTRKRLGL